MRARQIRSLTQKAAAHAGRRFQPGLAFEKVEPLIGVWGKQGGQPAQCSQYLLRLCGITRQGFAVKRDSRLGAPIATFFDLGGLQPQRNLQGWVLGGPGSGEKPAHVSLRRMGHLGQKLETSSRGRLFGLERHQLNELLACRHEIALAFEYVDGLVDQSVHLFWSRKSHGHT